MVDNLAQLIEAFRAELSRPKRKTKEGRRGRIHRPNSPEEVDEKRRKNKLESPKSSDNDCRHKYDTSTTDESSRSEEDYDRRKKKTFDG